MATNSNISPNASAERQILRRDFLKALFINVFFLAVLLGLYLANRYWNFLDKIAAKF